MSYTLLYASDCTACSRIADSVASLGVPGLEVASLHAPQTRAMFTAAGRPVPDQPTLVCQEGARLTVWTGLSMRLRLVRLFGVSRATAIVGLLNQEVRARAERRGERRAMDRRSLFTGGAAAGIGALVFGAGASPAQAQSSGQGTPEVIPLSAEDRGELMDSQPMREAIDQWGPAKEAEVFATRSPKGKLVGCVPHETTGAITVVTLGTNSPQGITVLPDAEREVLGYYKPTGEAMADLHLGEDQVRASAPKGGEVSAAVDYKCFVLCLGANVDGTCASACFACAAGYLVHCAICGACAGSLGVDCAHECS